MVYATIRRRAVDKGRSEDRRTRREVAAQADMPVFWFDTSMEERELGQSLQHAMNLLPEIYRSVLTLKIWGEMTFAEIAETLQIPLNTAASRYRYGLTELRRKLDPTITDTLQNVSRTT
jgi:RNA polymerase sigma-70 factor (ECF subfamily)